MESLSILCIGDIIGKPGRAFLKQHLKTIQQEHHIDFTVANVENAAGGFGITEKVYYELLGMDIDACTSGNHIYDKKEILGKFDQFSKLIRPLNYPPNNPGEGIRFFSVKNVKIAVINLIGRVFMGAYDCPFRCMDSILSMVQNETPLILVDFHAEATSEKQALSWHIDGKVSAVWGTHTHVQTADERILPNETASITDLGMVGAWDSVIGMGKETIIKRFLTQMPAKFDVPKSKRVIFNAIKLDIHPETGKSIGISRIQRQYQFDEPIDSSHD